MKEYISLMNYKYNEMHIIKYDTKNPKSKKEWLTENKILSTISFTSPLHRKEPLPDAMPSCPFHRQSDACSLYLEPLQ